MARIKPNSFALVIHDYLASPKFSALAGSTRDWIRRYLMVAAREETLGAYPVGVVRPALVQGFLDGYADRPGAQESARSALRFLERWALVRDRLPFPITTGTEIMGSTGGHKPWTDPQVAVAETYARPDIARAVTLAANTGQRGSDLFRMHPNDLETVDGRLGINILRKKNGDVIPLWIPFTQPLLSAMATWPRRPAPFLLKPTGEAWGSRKQLSTAWERERDRNLQLAPCTGMVLHGLRATACVRLRRAGATPQQISDMVLLSVPMVERYCRFADQKVSAIAAVHHLDRMRTGAEQEQNNSTPNHLPKALKE